MPIPEAALPRPTPAPSAEVALFSLGGHDGHLREVNDAFADLLGLAPEQINGRSLLELVHPDDLTPVVAGLSALQRGAVETLFECRFLQPDGRSVHLQLVARQVPGTDLWWAAGRDTTAFHRLLAEQLDLRARLDLALGQATAAIWELDIVRGQLSWEPQAASILGVPAAWLPRNTDQLAAAVHPDDAEPLRAALARFVEVGALSIGVRIGQDAGLRHLSLRGQVLDRDRRGKPLRGVGLVLDVTTETAMGEQMLRMVMTDALTGAPNRRAFDKALRSEWRRCTRAAQPLSILMVDIDNFKGFNDRFGHLVGDDVLCVIARTLTATLHREGDLLTRFGGEEFAIVLPVADAAGALAVATQLVAAVRATEMRQAPGWSLRVSVGSASWQPGDAAVKSGELLARADDALFAAKVAGKDRAVGYEQFLAARAALETAMVNGLAEREFELYYQPLIALETGAAIGFEALVRWNRPGHGLVPPDSFVPVAETSALICDLGRWALREAACQLASWSQTVVDPRGELRMAVNVSGRHVASPTIVADVEAALAVAGIAPGRLELELTETTLADGTLVKTHLAALRALGVTIAIDDFGTGYTSIGQFPQLPADTLKIDRSFIASDDPRQQALVRLITEAAHAFDLAVVAEGIEDERRFHDLRSLGCDAAQGYLLGRPMPAGMVASWLADWRLAAG